MLGGRCRSRVRILRAKAIELTAQAPVVYTDRPITAADDFGLEQRDRRRHERVRVRFADTADRCCDPFQDRVLQIRCPAKTWAMGRVVRCSGFRQQRAALLPPSAGAVHAITDATGGADAPYRASVELASGAADDRAGRIRQ
jgi:hypothetical protein